VAQIVLAAMVCALDVPPKLNAHLARREKGESLMDIARELGGASGREQCPATLKLAGILHPSAAFWHRSASAICGSSQNCMECECGRAVCRVYFRHQHLACRRCWNAVYASQKYDQNGRKRLKASKLRLDLPARHQRAIPAQAKMDTPQNLPTHS
jgi:hypothetical protein